MQRGTGDRDTFRVGAAISVIVLWVKLLAYLRNILLDFAVFVRGYVTLIDVKTVLCLLSSLTLVARPNLSRSVFYVVRRLLAFLVSLGIILFAFAQMFHTVRSQLPTSSVLSAIINDGSPSRNIPYPVT
jgi:hypothetical protein